MFTSLHSQPEHGKKSKGTAKKIMLYKGQCEHRKYDGETYNVMQRTS